MKLVERKLGIEIEIKENTVSVLVLEKVTLRLQLVEELCAQLNGQNGNWLLIENEKNYELAKCAEIILEPFSLQLNNKKVKTKLYQEMNTVAETYMYLQGVELHSRICNYLENLGERIVYPIKYEEEWNALEIFKGYNVELSEESCDTYERICNYIKIMKHLCGVSIFFAVNLKQYLSEEQVLELYKIAQYNKIQLVLIEFCMSQKRMECEEMYIIDKDGCIIIY